VEFENLATYKEGDDALKLFLATEAGYPESGIDSCLIGDLQSDVLIRKDGSVELVGTTDYSNLGPDFLFESIKLIPKLQNKWSPATYNGKMVNSMVPLRIEFRPTAETCKSIVTQYEETIKRVDEAVTLHDTEKTDEALLIINQALETFPTNTEWLYFRGVMYMTLKDNDSACKDFGMIRSILPTPWYESWIDIICGF